MRARAAAGRGAGKASLYRTCAQQSVALCAGPVCVSATHADKMTEAGSDAPPPCPALQAIAACATRAPALSGDRTRAP